MDTRLFVQREVKGLQGDEKGTSLVVVATAWGLLVGARMIYPILIPHLQTAYGLTLSAAGLLMTVLWLCSSLGQLPSGVLADRYNERTLLAASTIIVAVALGSVITAETPLMVFLATALWGLGHSIFPVARIIFLAETYSERLGSALGVTMATGDIGQTVLPPVAAILAVAITWQAGLGFVIPFLVLIGILIYVYLPRQRTPNKVTKTQTARDILNVFRGLRRPGRGYMAIILFLYIFIWQSFTAFYPTYLTDVKELSPSTASVLFGLFFAVGVVIKPVSGVAYDRIGTRKSLVIVLLPPVAGFLLLPVVDGIWGLVAITAILSTMLGSGAITQSYLADSFSESMKGTGLGVIRTTSATLGAGGPVLYGVIADYGYFNEGYLLLSVMLVGAIVLTLRIPNQRRV